MNAVKKKIVLSIEAILVIIIMMISLLVLKSAFAFFFSTIGIITFFTLLRKRMYVASTLYLLSATIFFVSISFSNLVSHTLNERLMMIELCGSADRANLVSLALDVALLAFVLLSSLSIIYLTHELVNRIDLVLFKFKPIKISHISVFGFKKKRTIILNPDYRLRLCKYNC